MHFAVFFLILAGAASVFVLYPHLRIIAGVVFAFFTGLLVYLFIDQGGEVQRETALTAPEELILSDVDLVEATRFYRLEGRVQNTSPSYRLRDFDVEVTLRDCAAEDSLPEDCAIIAQDQGIARVDVPPGQTRTFSAVIAYVAAPPIKGVAVWDHRIVKVRATD